ncbi:BTB domain-containing protein [Mycena chlorophos]|uniref:BTB domain-containing protein n=1 Tax=Mycena chlorophos TaxID=658473 RepID=A0A8H6WQC1_MYCCL|nr:BTB domain-containing protein [Mycena chlorophos]
MLATAPSTPSVLTTLTRSPLWFSDGNIVLVARGVGFKVHQGQLARHSEVFADVFSIPQPPEQDLVEGCAWVELYDSPDDVLYFLSALYDGLYFHAPQASDFPVLAGVLRLSTKYLVDHLRLRCIARLESEWPSTLAGWDAREQSATNPLGHYAPRIICAHPILIIDLALELNVPSLLPAAMYDLARYGPSKILAGTPSIAHLPLIAPANADVKEQQQEQVDTPSPQQMTLTPEFLIETFRGRELAQRYLADFINAHLDDRDPSPDCDFAECDLDPIPSRQCRESFYFIMLNMLRAVGGITCGRDADPLFSLVQGVNMLSRTDFSSGGSGGKQCGLRMCMPCKVDFAKCVQKAREEVWSEMPGWFGLKVGMKVGEGDMDQE